jgi:hypothetical protein
VNGRIVLHKKTTENSLIVSPLPSGVYILRFPTEGGYVAKKFIKK